MPQATLRLRYQRKTEGVQYDSVLSALLDGSTDHYIEWEDTKEQAVLDVDWHGQYKPDSNKLDALIQSCQPQPQYWWLSQGGGIHMLFSKHNETPASTFAAIAGLHFLEKSTCTGVEVISRTRGCDPAGLITHVETRDLRGLRGWLKRGGADPHLVDEWLVEKGWSIGKRLPHSECLLDPRGNAKGGVPVFVTERGVVCYVCEAQGVGQGFRSWAEIVGSRDVSRVSTMAKHFVPWSNAEHYVKGLWGDRASRFLLKVLYRAILETVHPADHPLIPSCFMDFPYILGEGSIWLNAETYAPTDLRDKTVFGSLPSAQYAKKDGNKWAKPKRAIAKWSQHYVQGQKPPGYPVHQVVHGAPLYGKFMAYSDDHVRVLAGNRQDQPRYVPIEDRQSLEEAKAHLQQQYPGICWEYLLLLLAARGFAESGRGKVPQLLVTGSSGAGKSITPRLAAELLADRAIQINYHSNHDKLGESLGYAFQQQPGFVYLDEFAKRTYGEEQVEAFTPLLLTDRQFSYRRLRVGPMEVTIRSALIITNVDFSPRVMEDVQIGRRFIRVDLPQTAPAEWEVTSGGYEGWRLRSPANRTCADTIYSHVIDRWFLSKPPKFKDVALELGFDTQQNISEDEVGGALGALVQELFAAVCEAPAADSARWKGPGWKVIPYLNEGRIGKAWTPLHDAADPTVSRQIQGQDLAPLLGLKCPTQLKVSKIGTEFGFRFVTRNVNSRSKNFKVNEDLR